MRTFSDSGADIGLAADVRFTEKAQDISTFDSLAQQSNLPNLLVGETRH